MPAFYGKVALFYSPSSAWIALGGIALLLPFIGLLARQPIVKAGMEPQRT